MDKKLLEDCISYIFSKDKNNKSTYTTFGKKVNIEEINNIKTKEELINSISKEGNKFVTIKINEL
jgi:hypothetical protein